jgi:hypothetical protein
MFYESIRYNLSDYNEVTLSTCGCKIASPQDRIEVQCCYRRGFLSATSTPSCSAQLSIHLDQKYIWPRAFVDGLFFRHHLCVTPSASLDLQSRLTYAAWLGIGFRSVPRVNPLYRHPVLLSVLVDRVFTVADRKVPAVVWAEEQVVGVAVCYL